MSPFTGGHEHLLRNTFKIERSHINSLPRHFAAQPFASRIHQRATIQIRRPGKQAAQAAGFYVLGFGLHGAWGIQRHKDFRLWVIQEIRIRHFIGVNNKIIATGLVFQIKIICDMVVSFR